MRNPEKVQVCLLRKLTVSTGRPDSRSAFAASATGRSKMRGSIAEILFWGSSILLNRGPKTLDCGALIRKVREDSVKIRQTQYFRGARA